MDEYAIIREGLINLLCVGDTIHRIHRIIGGFNHKTGGHDLFYVISEEVITKITPGESLKVVLYTGFGCDLPFKNIEIYEGVPYIWTATDMYEDYSLEAKLKEIGRIINDKNTRHEPSILKRTGGAAILALCG